jgi:hypothetical protein
VLVRFGKWEELLLDDALGPAISVERDVMCPDSARPSTKAFVHYGRGVAHAVLAGVAKADSDSPRGGRDSSEGRGRSESGSDVSRGGVGVAAHEHLNAAQDELRLMLAATAVVPPNLAIFNVKVKHMLAVAVATLQGELWYRHASLSTGQHSFGHAFRELRRSVVLYVTTP